MSDNGQYQLDEIYQRNSLEWFALIRKFSDEAKLKEGKELLDWKRQEIAELLELLKAHKRDLDYRAGDHKPEALFAELDLRGEGLSQ
jgi:hypothetical protein